jgi:hypothetical protein
MTTFVTQEKELVFKCQWCCSTADYFCSGQNHYCERCWKMVRLTLAWLSAMIGQMLDTSQAKANRVATGNQINWRDVLKKDKSRQCDGKGKWWVIRFAAGDRFAGPRAELYLPAHRAVHLGCHTRHTVWSTASAAARARCLPPRTKSWRVSWADL